MGGVFDWWVLLRDGWKYMGEGYVEFFWADGAPVSF